MAFAIDAILLIAAANRRDPRNENALGALQRAARGREAFYLFWPVILAYLRVTTPPHLLEHPLSVEDAWLNLDTMLSLPQCRIGSEGEGFAVEIKKEAVASRALGRLIHDVHLVVLMRQHGVTTIWTYDRDFQRFPGITVVDPSAA